MGKTALVPLERLAGYQKHLGRTGGYRFLLADAYPFQQSLRQTIEHSGTEQQHPDRLLRGELTMAERLPAGTVDPPTPR